MFDFYCKIASYNLTLKSKRNIRDTLYFFFFFFKISIRLNTYPYLVALFSVFL